MTLSRANETGKRFFSNEINLVAEDVEGIELAPWDVPKLPASRPM
jgi:hypothetical protein